MLSITICKCTKNYGIELKKEQLKIRTTQGDLWIDPMKETPKIPKFGFCKKCHQPFLSKDMAKKVVAGAVEEKQKELGLITGQELKELRKRLGMTYLQMGKFLNIPYSNFAHWEHGTLIQSKSTDEFIRIKAKEYLKTHNPTRKKLKNIFAYMIEKADTSKLFLNKMMFYVDFWQIKKQGKSITGSKYVPLQYGPCPDNYHEILQEMIDQEIITPTQNHLFKLNETPDMSAFTEEEMKTIDDVIALAQNDKGQAIFDKSHEEEGFLETPLYEHIPEKYAESLRVEELLDEIAVC